MQCVNNLKQIGLALQNFENSRHYLPACAIGPNNDASPYAQGWMMFILPQIEENTIYNAFNQNANWYDPVNQTVVNTQINTYLCPSAVGTHTVSGMIDDLSYNPPAGCAADLGRDDRLHGYLGNRPFSLYRPTG